MVQTGCVGHRAFVSGTCRQAQKARSAKCHSQRQRGSRGGGGKKEKVEAPKELVLDPVELGRRSRQALDEVWSQVTRLSSPTSSFSLDADVETSDFDNFDTPQAPFTNVLVIGGTGKTGRILVRKLLLRGYTVRVLVRDSDGTAASTLPASVELLKGDVFDMADCQKAVLGMQKIIYCATSDLDLSQQVSRVDHLGVGNLARSFMDMQHRASQKSGSTPGSLKIMLADFSDFRTQEEWDLMHVGPLDDDNSSSAQFYRGQDFANALLTENQSCLEFTGSIYSRGGVVDWGGPISGLEAGEGLVLNCLADGKAYLAMLVDPEGNEYSMRFVTRLGWNTVRLPFNAFRAVFAESPPLDLTNINCVKFRFDKNALADVPLTGDPEEDQRLRNSFSFEMDWLKLLPTPEEPTFVLVSCAGVSDATSGSDEEARTERRTAAKRRGEQLLRNGGLGYTIVRPGPLLEEPGGYKAMVFDQANRITQGIGSADVADICLRALHNQEAVNKCFEVCYEFAPEGKQMYELVAHIPEKSNNYLVPALSALQKNT